MHQVNRACSNEGAGDRDAIRVACCGNAARAITKVYAKGDWRSSRRTRHCDLSAFGLRHPFLGRLNFCRRFAFIAAQEIRHTNQLWEIGQNLRKDV